MNARAEAQMSAWDERAVAERDEALYGEWEDEGRLALEDYALDRDEDEPDWSDYDE